MTYFHQCENLPNIPIHVTPLAEQNTSRTRFSRLLSMAGISSIFRKYLLKFIRPAETKTYSVNESVGIKLISRLRLSFCHVRELKFRQNFKDTLNPLFFQYRIWNYDTLFLRCLFYAENRAILINDLENIDQSLPTLSVVNLVDLLSHGNEMFNDKKKQATLMCTIKFLNDFQGYV